jgi:hypothetical protein
MKPASKKNAVMTSYVKNDHIADLLGISAPIGADLVRNDYAGDHAHREAEGEQTYPESDKFPVHIPPGENPKQLKKDNESRHADRVRRPQNVVADRHRELDSRGEESFRAHAILRLTRSQLGDGQ